MQIITDFETDGIICDPYNKTVTDKLILDVGKNNDAHRDGIQIIPREAGKPNVQYALGTISDVTIQGNIIYSDGNLQPISLFDGMLDRVEVLVNKMSTNSRHHISLAGVLSGVVANNEFMIRNQGHVLANTILYPARIGGAVCINPDDRPEHRVYNTVEVLHFKNKYMKYGLVQGTRIQDRRRLRRKSHNLTQLAQFDYSMFIGLVETNLYETGDFTGTNNFCAKLQKIALLCGDIVR